MRKQYHSRNVNGQTYIWDVHRLVRLSLDLPVVEIHLSEIKELDEQYWFQDERDPPTCRRVAEHAVLIRDTDLRYPIILSADGRVMDGMHRVAKAFMEKRTLIHAVQFAEDPSPDYIDVDVDALPYESPDE